MIPLLDYWDVLRAHGLTRAHIGLLGLLHSFTSFCTLGQHHHILGFRKVWLPCFLWILQIRCVSAYLLLSTGRCLRKGSEVCYGIALSLGGVWAPTSPRGAPSPDFYKLCVALLTPDLPSLVSRIVKILSGWLWPFLTTALENKRKKSPGAGEPVGARQGDKGWEERGAW